MASRLPGETARERLRQLISQDRDPDACRRGRFGGALGGRGGGRPARPRPSQDRYRHDAVGRAAHSGARPWCIRPAAKRAFASSGLYTHFAMADAADKTSAREQLSRFLAAIQACGNDARGLMLHSAASAATIDIPESHFDMVRVGIATDGAPAFRRDAVPPAPAACVPARWAGSRRSRTCRPARGSATDRPIASIIPPGSAWCRWATPTGHCCSFELRGDVQLQGEVALLRGRVCMDGSDDHRVDQFAGRQGGRRGGDHQRGMAPPPNSVESLASLAGTINYEIMCRLGPRPSAASRWRSVL